MQKGRGEVTAFPGGLTRVSRANGRITSNSSGGSMQTDPGGSSSETGSDQGIVAAYSYAARYVYSEVVVQNDNLLRLTPPTDSYARRATGPNCGRNRAASWRDIRTATGTLLIEPKYVTLTMKW